MLGHQRGLCLYLPSIPIPIPPIVASSSFLYTLVILIGLPITFLHCFNYVNDLGVDMLIKSGHPLIVYSLKTVRGQPLLSEITKQRLFKPGSIDNHVSKFLERNYIR